MAVDNYLSQESRMSRLPSFYFYFIRLEFYNRVHANLGSEAKLGPGYYR